MRTNSYQSSLKGKRLFNVAIKPLSSLIVILLLLPILTFSQVAINEDDTEAEPSAMLDIKSTDKGMLIPRMTVTQRDSISFPANGLMVYITDDSTFSYFNGFVWKNLLESSDSQIEEWQLPTLLNGISNYGGDYSEAGYYKDRNRVFLRGLVANVGYNKTIFVLPAGYRPIAATSVITIGNDQPKRIQITPDGNVMLLYSTAGWLSLENISFRID